MNEVNLAIPAITAGAIAFSVIAIVKLVDDAFNKDWQTIAKILGAAVAGALIGHFSVAVGGFTGLLYGLGSSGLITTVNFFGTIKVDKASDTIG